ETDGRYGFGHDRLREVAYAEASEARRRLYHRRALGLLQAEQAPPAELLRHALGADLRAEAFRLSLVTGDAAMRLFAARDAIGRYEQARQLAEGGSVPTDDISTADRRHLYLQ